MNVHQNSNYCNNFKIKFKAKVKKLRIIASYKSCYLFDDIRKFEIHVYNLTDQDIAMWSHVSSQEIVCRGKCTCI